MTYIASPDCVACEVEGGIALLDLKSNTYFSLDPVGAHVWGQLSQPRTLDDLAGAVAAEYDITADACRSDIANLLDDLSRHDLVTTA